MSSPTWTTGVLFWSIVGAEKAVQVRPTRGALLPTRLSFDEPAFTVRQPLYKWPKQHGTWQKTWQKSDRWTNTFAVETIKSNASTAVERFCAEKMNQTVVQILVIFVVALFVGTKPLSVGTNSDGEFLKGTWCQSDQTINACRYALDLKIRRQ